jgi:hypothetical protein
MSGCPVFSAHLSQNLRRVIRTRSRIFVAQNFVSGLQVFIEDLDSISVVFSCFTHILSFSDLIRSLLYPVFRFASPVNCISSEHDGVCLWLIGICASLVEYVCDPGIEFDVGRMLCYLSCLLALARSRTVIAFTVQALLQPIDIPEFHADIVNVLLSLRCNRSPGDLVFAVCEAAIMLIRIDGRFSEL